MLGKPPITAKGTNPIIGQSKAIAQRVAKGQLPLGTVIRARVLKQLGHGRVVILFNGRKISARTDCSKQSAPSLQPGRDCLFFVKPSANEVVLRLLSPSRAQSHQLLKIWNTAQAGRQRFSLLLKQLHSRTQMALALAKGSSRAIRPFNSLVSSLFLDLTSANRAVQLKDMVARMGLFWEAKVARAFQEGEEPDPPSDLKALLQLLGPALDKEGKKECRELLWLIEQQQQINVKNEALGQWWFFLIPILQDQDLEPAAVYVKKERGRGIRVVIHLELSKLGRMEVVVLFPAGEEPGGKNFVDVAMGVENEEVKRMVEQAASSLDESLRSQGFSLRSFHCEVMEAACLLPPMLASRDLGPIVDVMV